MTEEGFTVRCRKCGKPYPARFPLHPLGYCDACAGVLSKTRQEQVQAETDIRDAETDTEP